MPYGYNVTDSTDHLIVTLLIHNPTNPDLPTVCMCQHVHSQKAKGESILIWGGAWWESLLFVCLFTPYDNTHSFMIVHGTIITLKGRIKNKMNYKIIMFYLPCLIRWRKSRSLHIYKHDQHVWWVCVYGMHVWE